MNDPDLVVLDEPTDGLDPGSKETRDVLQKLRAEGKTIFLNSHLLGEVEQTATARRSSWKAGSSARARSRK